MTTDTKPETLEELMFAADVAAGEFPPVSAVYASTRMQARAFQAKQRAEEREVSVRKLFIICGVVASSTLALGVVGVLNVIGAF